MEEEGEQKEERGKRRGRKGGGLRQGFWRDRRPCSNGLQ